MFISICIIRLKLYLYRENIRYTHSFVNADYLVMGDEREGTVLVAHLTRCHPAGRGGPPAPAAPNRKPRTAVQKDEGPPRREEANAQKPSSLIQGWGVFRGCRGTAMQKRWRGRFNWRTLELGHSWSGASAPDHQDSGAFTSQGAPASRFPLCPGPLVP